MNVHSFSRKNMSKRTQILIAAEAILAEHGFHAFSMQKNYKNLSEKKRLKRFSVIGKKMIRRSISIVWFGKIHSSVC